MFYCATERRASNGRQEKKEKKPVSNSCIGCRLLYVLRFSRCCPIEFARYVGFFCIPLSTICRKALRIDNNRYYRSFCETFGSTRWRYSFQSIFYIFFLGCNLYSAVDSGHWAPSDVMSRAFGEPQWIRRLHRNCGNGIKFIGLSESRNAKKHFSRLRIQCGQFNHFVFVDA